MTWIYRKPEAVDIRGVCVLCNKNPQKRVKGCKYQALCNTCDDKRYGKKSKSSLVSYRKYKKDICERCAFIPEHRCQLDVHHINGNHRNNDPNNLITLCANCHRLEHKI